MLYRIIEYRKYYFLFSGIIILAGLIAMGYSTARYGSPVLLGIDFRGGSMFELQFEGPSDEDSLREVFARHGLDDVTIQRLGAPDENRWQIRAEWVEEETQQELLADLEESIAPINPDTKRINRVSPAVGTEVTTAAVIAVLVAAVIILGFIVMAFRQVPNAFRYGACAIATMFHDVLVTMGVMSILGILFGWQVDALFLTAMLTVVGFSVQDTIVMFDRIRENIRKRRGEPYDVIVNRSVLETIHRSLGTQLNAIFVMVAILLFGGESIKQFIGIMLIGLISGTYSSIFTAVPLLVAWEKGEIPFLKGRSEVVNA